MSKMLKSRIQKYKCAIVGEIKEGYETRNRHAVRLQRSST